MLAFIAASSEKNIKCGLDSLVASRWKSFEGCTQLSLENICNHWAQEKMQPYKERSWQPTGFEKLFRVCAKKKKNTPMKSYLGTWIMAIAQGRITFGICGSCRFHPWHSQLKVFEWKAMSERSWAKRNGSVVWCYPDSSIVTQHICESAKRVLSVSLLTFKNIILEPVDAVWFNILNGYFSGDHDPVCIKFCPWCSQPSCKADCTTLILLM